MAESQENAPTAGEEAESQQTLAAEGSAEKTFTQEEVDAIVKRRLDRLNGKHSTDTSALEKRIAELEAKNAETEKEAKALKAAKELADWQARASAETGIPASVLRGSTAEEVMEHAKAIKAAVPVAPSFSDQGKPADIKGGARAQFDKFMSSNFND